MTSSQPKLNSTNQTWFSRVRGTIQSNVVETVTASVALSIVLLVGSGINTWTIYRGFKDKVAQQFQLEKQSGKVVHLDEVLTMSARMAASTGDPQWEERYQSFEPELGKAIENVIALAPEAYEGEAAKTDAANIKLVEMETQAFQLVRQGKKQEAFEVLFSPEYQSQKEIYAQGIENTLANVEQEINNQLNEYRNRLFQSVIVAGVILIILVFSWLVILDTVKGYIRERDRAQKSLEQSQAKLLNLNTELEQRSEALAAQEQAKTRENQMLQTEVGNILEVVSAVEEGDLTVQAQVGEGLTGLVSDTFNRLIEEWIGVLKQMLDTSAKVAHNANNLEQIANAVAYGADQQAESVNRVLKLSEAVESSAQDSAQKVAQTKQSLLNLNEAVESEQGAILNLTEGIGVLQQGTDKIIQQMKTLGEFVGLADQFVQEQSKISQQTQVLALNASLVAARAAQQENPRLFGLVAREFQGIAEQVGQLSQQTNEDLATLEQRTAQIHKVVSSIDGEVQNLGGLVGGFNQGVQQSSQLFQNVQSVTEEAIAAGETVAQSSQEIVKTTEMTASALREIAQLAEKTAELTQESQERSEKMGKFSTQLLERVEFFQLPGSKLSSYQDDRELNGKLPTINVNTTEVILADDDEQLAIHN